MQLQLAPESGKMMASREISSMPLPRKVTSFMGKTAADDKISFIALLLKNWIDSLEAQSRLYDSIIDLVINFNFRQP